MDVDWSKTSYADSTEAAIHHALIRFTRDIEDRNHQRTSKSWPDLSDIYMTRQPFPPRIVARRPDVLSVVRGSLSLKLGGAR